MNTSVRARWLPAFMQSLQKAPAKSSGIGTGERQGAAFHAAMRSLFRGLLLSSRKAQVSDPVCIQQL